MDNAFPVAAASNDTGSPLRGYDAFVPNRGWLRNPLLDKMRHLRIPRSADVSASMNAGRENSRSAYFMSGAAGLGS